MWKQEIIDSMEVRLIIQTTVFTLSLVAWQLVYFERRQNNKPFYSYMNIAFGAMLLQNIFMLTVFLASLILQVQLPEVFMPIFDHFLKIISIIYLTAAFLCTFVKSNTVVQRFIKISLGLIILLLPLIWWPWYQYQLDFPGRGFAYFGGDLFIEQAITALCFFLIYFVIKSPLNNKNGFLMAVVILAAKQILHIANILLSYNTIPSVLLIERLLPVLFFYFIIISIHKEILSKLKKARLERNLFKKQLNKEAISALVYSLEAKDEYTKGHSERVAEYALAIGQSLNLNQREMEMLYYGALLHDIGKIGVTETILNHPSNLNSQQMDLIKKHPETGAHIISKIEPLREVAPAVRHHHEWYNGTGYPDRLKSEEIPLHARIIAIADALDAMASDRVYRPALSSEMILEELKKSAGTQFDPKIIKSFLETVPLKNRQK
ncbi:HD-GYP domain-containing protein [Thermincola potens]|uniref:Metal dependent phosphohydrolase n=1 Tax=Thermincola potens (strain JR) TaxID=635013 RepID=D5X8T1_THEPJ|nr:HD-GYP domain-containing protein [Thermincola potens]ADG82957.1 metal dependent phosphohydrolase [Thermincola potens JR]